MKARINKNFTVTLYAETKKEAKELNNFIDNTEERVLVDVETRVEKSRHL